MPKFAETLLPLALPGTYTYRIPEGTQLSIGMRVLVPFGRKKIFTAIVTALHDREPKGYEVKEILGTLDNKPILRHPQLEFWQWIADYYLCSMGEVYKAAVPSGLKVESETTISVNPDYEEDESSRLSDHERVILDFTAQRGRVQIAEIAKATGFKTVERNVSHLLDMGALHVSERVVDNYRPKTEACVRLTIAREEEEKLHQFFDMLKRAPKQESLLLAYLDMSHWLQSGAAKEVSKENLLKRAGVSSAVLNDAVKRGLLLAIITGAKVKEIELRYKNLGLKEIHIGCNVKLGVFRDLVSRYNLKPEEIAYMGDDIPDYEVMKEVGLPCCPSDAATEIKEISKYVSVCKGGEGCVRDLVEQVLKSQGAWMSDNTTFGW